jgi:hypothetical protein
MSGGSSRDRRRAKRTRGIAEKVLVQVSARLNKQPPASVAAPSRDAEAKSTKLFWWGLGVSASFAVIVQWANPEPTRKWILLCLALGVFVTSIIG